MIIQLFIFIIWTHQILGGSQRFLFLQLLFNFRMGWPKDVFSTLLALSFALSKSSLLVLSLLSGDLGCRKGINIRKIIMEHAVRCKFFWGTIYKSLVIQLTKLLFFGRSDPYTNMLNKLFR